MTIPRIAGAEAELTAWRRALHAIPELDFDLPETAAFVAARLREIGVDAVEEGIARTGLVATIRGKGEGPVVGLRADMDALPIQEVRDLPWRSQRPGRMHACGHDGHMAILLGAARYLAETRDFAGTAALIFQPSEEMSGGGRVMVEEGVMERFGIGRVFGIHNLPGLALGEFATRAGAIMGSADEFAITMKGRGGHAAYPHETVDPVPAALAIGQALIALPARRLDPLARAVVSLTMIEAGTASNVIPETVVMKGTVRTLDGQVRADLAEAVRQIAEATARGFGCAAETRYAFGYPVTVNDPGETAFAVSVAREIAGDGAVDADAPPTLGAEDFAYMLEARPGAYVFLGTGPGAVLHHPEFDYNDAATPIGASYFARLVERALPLG